MPTEPSGAQQPKQTSLLDAPFWIGAIILIGILLILGLIMCLKRHYEDDISQCRPCRRKLTAAAEGQEENFYDVMRLGASKRRISQIPNQLAVHSAAASASASGCNTPSAGNNASPDCRQQRNRRQEAAQRFFDAVTHGADRLLPVQRLTTSNEESNVGLENGGYCSSNGGSGRRVLEAAEIRIEQPPAEPSIQTQQPTQSPPPCDAVVIQIEPPPEAEDIQETDDEHTIQHEEPNSPRHQLNPSTASVLDEDEEKALNALVEEVANRILGMSHSHSAENILRLVEDDNADSGRVGGVKRRSLLADPRRRRAHKRKKDFAHTRSLTATTQKSIATEGSNRSYSTVNDAKSQHRRRSVRQREASSLDFEAVEESERWASASVRHPSGLHQDSAESGSFVGVGGGGCHSCCSLPVCGPRQPTSNSSSSRHHHRRGLCLLKADIQEPAASCLDDRSLVDRLVRQASSGCRCRHCRRAFRAGLRDLRQRFRHQHCRRLPPTEDLREEDLAEEGAADSRQVASWVDRHSAAEAKQLHRCNSIEDINAAAAAQAQPGGVEVKLGPGFGTLRRRPLIKSHSDEIVYEESDIPLEKLHAMFLQEAPVAAVKAFNATDSRTSAGAASAARAPAKLVAKSSLEQSAASQTLLAVPSLNPDPSASFEAAPRRDSPTSSTANSVAAPTVAGDTFIYVEDWNCRALESHSAILPAAVAAADRRRKTFQRQRRHQTAKRPKRSTLPPPPPPPPRRSLTHSLTH